MQNSVSLHVRLRVRREALSGAVRCGLERPSALKARSLALFGRLPRIAVCATPCARLHRTDVLPWSSPVALCCLGTRRVLVWKLQSSPLPILRNHPYWRPQAEDLWKATAAAAAVSKAKGRGSGADLEGAVPPRRLGGRDGPLDALTEVDGMGSGGGGAGWDQRWGGQGSPGEPPASAQRPLSQQGPMSAQSGQERTHADPFLRSFDPGRGEAANGQAQGQGQGQGRDQGGNARGRIAGSAEPAATIAGSDEPAGPLSAGRGSQQGGRPASGFGPASSVRSRPDGPVPAADKGPLRTAQGQGQGQGRPSGGGAVGAGGAAGAGGPATFAAQNFASASSGPPSAQPARDAPPALMVTRLEGPLGEGTRGGGLGRLAEEDEEGADDLSEPRLGASHLAASRPLPGSGAAGRGQQAAAGASPGRDMLAAQQRLFRQHMTASAAEDGNASDNPILGGHGNRGLGSGEGPWRAGAGGGGALGRPSGAGGGAAWSAAGGASGAGPAAPPTSQRALGSTSLAPSSPTPSSSVEKPRLSPQQPPAPQQQQPKEGLLIDLDDTDEEGENGHDGRGQNRQGGNGAYAASSSRGSMPSSSRPPAQATAAMLAGLRDQDDDEEEDDIAGQL